MEALEITPLSVNTRVVVEKPLHDYRVETGGGLVGLW